MFLPVNKKSPHCPNLFRHSPPVTIFKFWYLSNIIIKSVSFKFAFMVILVGSSPIILLYVLGTCGYTIVQFFCYTGATHKKTATQWLHSYTWKSGWFMGLTRCNPRKPGQIAGLLLNPHLRRDGAMGPIHYVRFKRRIRLFSPTGVPNPFWVLVRAPYKN